MRPLYQIFNNFFRRPGTLGRLFPWIMICYIRGPQWGKKTRPPGVHSPTPNFSTFNTLKMKSKTFYNLVRVDRHGKKQPVMLGPNNSTAPFPKKGEAKAWAEENPEHFPDNLYAIEEVFELVEAPETVEAPAGVESGEGE